MGGTRTKAWVCDNGSAFPSRYFRAPAAAFPTVPPLNSRCFTLREVSALLGGAFSFGVVESPQGLT